MPNGITWTRHYYLASEILPSPLMEVASWEAGDRLFVLLYPASQEETTSDIPGLGICFPGSELSFLFLEEL